MPMNKIVTPEFRVSFPALFEPKGFEGQDPKYKVNMLFSKSTDLSSLKKLANDAILEKWPTKEKRPTNIRTPFRDGDKDKADQDGYQDCIFVAATSKMKPGVVDSELNPILDAEEMYAGCYARASITAYAYDKMGNVGVAFGLQHVQKVKDGEPFSGRGKAEDDFEAIESDGGSSEGGVAEEENMFG